MKHWFEKIQKPIIALAPMHGYTYSSFRMKCRASGADCVYSEMVASEAIIRNVPQAMEMLRFDEKERPVILQIFGSKPNVMAQAAKIIQEKYHPDGIDINFGCPVQKAATQGFGSCQLANIQEASNIVKTVSEAIDIPLSVKMRLVSQRVDENVEFVKTLFASGAKIIAIHGRTRTQKYGGHADWNLLRKIKQECPDIPILGSGDVDSLQFLKDNLGCLDGALIGRAAKRDPAIFEELIKIKND